MLHNNQNAKKSTPLLRSRHLESAIHHPSNGDFDVIVQEDEAKANHEGGIHHSLKDFDELIHEDEIIRREEDEIKRREEEEVNQETENHNVDADNLDFSQDTENDQDNIIDRENHYIDQQDIDNFHNDIMKNHHNVYIATGNHRPSSVSEDSGIGSIADEKISEAPIPQTAVPTAPHRIGNSHPVGIFTSIALLLTLVGIAMVVFSIIRKRRAKRKLGKEVFMYILDFDVEDVDLTRAVTGGWHGTYKNNLRDGVDTDPDTDDDCDYFGEDFADDQESDGDEDIYDDEDVIFEASGRSERSNDNMIVFTEEGEEEHLFVGHKNIYFNSDVDVDDEDIYYASDNDLFSPVNANAQ